MKLEKDYKKEKMLLKLREYKSDEEYEWAD